MQKLSINPVPIYASILVQDVQEVKKPLQQEIQYCVLGDIEVRIAAMDAAGEYCGDMRPIH